MEAIQMSLARVLSLEIRDVSGFLSTNGMIPLPIYLINGLPESQDDFHDTSIRLPGLSTARV